MMLVYTFHSLPYLIINISYLLSSTTFSSISLIILNTLSHIPRCDHHPHFQHAPLHTSDLHFCHCKSSFFHSPPTPVSALHLPISDLWTGLLYICFSDFLYWPLILNHPYFFHLAPTRLLFTLIPPLTSVLTSNYLSPSSHTLTNLPTLSALLSGFFLPYKLTFLHLENTLCNFIFKKGKSKRVEKKYRE